GSFPSRAVGRRTRRRAAGRKPLQRPNERHGKGKVPAARFPFPVRVPHSSAQFHLHTAPPFGIIRPGAAWPGIPANPQAAIRTRNLMLTDPASRREWLASAAAVLGAGLAAAAEPAPKSSPAPRDEPFGFCLNTSTIDGQKLTLAEKIE